MPMMAMGNAMVEDEQPKGLEGFLTNPISLGSSRVGTTLGKADRRGNLYPTKQRPEQKIDAAVALMMAMGRAMIEDEDAKGLEGFLTSPIFG